ncbi:MAG: dehydratase [Actinobacteria bacterium BACL4 MAG-121001-bin59]|jgi:itaconyl-CoA hydratase|nr:MAG: dehydratase [Actinobacteria bacterium BACL4 MAG-121001-bin59]
MTKHEAVLGRFFEDYVVGDLYQHPFGRTINEADNTWFTLLTCNTNQNHFNIEFAKSNPITAGKVIVNSGLSVALALGISVMDMSQNAVANLGWTDIKLKHPLYVGDTMYAESICLDARESESRKNVGIISMKTRGLNQDGDEILSMLRTVMIAKKSSGIGQNYFPESKNGELKP